MVQSKKTQRDKDWLMLKRLVEGDIILNKNNPQDKRVRWWFFESRNPDTLVRLAKEYPEIIKECIARRPLLSSAVNVDMQKLDLQLHEEELMERQKDIEYWVPLKKELETLRHNSKKEK